MIPLVTILVGFSLAAPPVRASEADWDRLKEAILKCGTPSAISGAAPEKYLKWTSEPFVAGSQPPESRMPQQTALAKAISGISGVLGASTLSAPPSAPAASADSAEPRNKSMVTEGVGVIGSKLADGSSGADPFAAPRFYFSSSLDSRSMDSAWSLTIDADGKPTTALKYAASMANGGDIPAHEASSESGGQEAQEFLRTRIAWWLQALHDGCVPKAATYPPRP